MNTTKPHANKGKTTLMRSYTIILLIGLTTNGCMQTPEIPTSQETNIRESIIKNQAEATRAQEEYLQLQRQRH